MYNPYTPKTKKENIVSLTEQEHREYHSVHTTTPQWQESLKLSTVICSEFQWNTPMAIYPVWFMESFIETQIAQAEERGEERMKNEILKIIPCETAKSQLNTMAQNDRIDDENLILWQIRHWISCLWKDDSISSL